jgi:hypothetical protein
MHLSQHGLTEELLGFLNIRQAMLIVAAPGVVDVNAFDKTPTLPPDRIIGGIDLDAETRFAGVSHKKPTSPAIVSFDHDKVREEHEGVFIGNFGCRSNG